MTVRFIRGLIIFLVASGVCAAQSLKLPREEMLVLKPSESETTPLGVGSLDLLATKRVVKAPEGGRAMKIAVSATLDGAMSPSRPGVVYNNAMQQYGLVSGEITFAARDDFDVNSLPWRGSPPPRPLGPSATFVVDTGTGTEFLRVIRMLRNSAGILWVEPTVEYIPEVIE